MQLLEGQTLEWQGKPLPAQQSGEGTRVSLPQIPAMGWLTLPIRPAEEGTPTARILENGIETKRYRILWNADGQLCRIDDLRSDRQVLRAGENGNVLQVFEDNPHEFCAWNTEAYAFDKRQTVTHLAKVEVVENGAVQASVRFEWSFHHSKIQQTMTVYRDNDGIRFDTVCDWHEPNTLLKTCFPLELRSTKATYDIQFGNVERATHENTTWEIAQFEVCAHKWMDLSEGDYGVAMLNDCKYGCDIKEGNMRLTLVKAATDPDETSDIGEHRFTYCLLPHQGTWREAKVAHAAYELNDAVMAVNVSATQDGVLPESYSFASLDVPGVMIETVKRAENGEGWILRLYEYHQCHRKARLKLGFQPSVAWECDLMEQNEQPLDITEEGIPLTFTPYEIKTIHVQ